jgi:hypothetical protein
MLALKRMRARISHEPFISGAGLIGARPEIRNHPGPKQRIFLTNGSGGVEVHYSCLNVDSFTEIHETQGDDFAEL